VENKQQVAEALTTAVTDNSVGGAAGKATVTGGMTLFYGGYSLNDVAMFIGAIIAIAGFITQAVAQYNANQSRKRDDARKDELHAMRMAQLRNAQPKEGHVPDHTANLAVQKDPNDSDWLELEPLK